jgi:Anti-sigma factor NepR
VLTVLPEVAQETIGEPCEPQSAVREGYQEPSLPPQVIACIGERLQAFYGQLIKEPVPDSLLQILAPLNKKGRATHGH